MSFEWVYMCIYQCTSEEIDVYEDCLYSVSINKGVLKVSSLSLSLSLSLSCMLGVSGRSVVSVDVSGSRLWLVRVLFSNFFFFLVSVSCLCLFCLLLRYFVLFCFCEDSLLPAFCWEAWRLQTQWLLKI
jgi:hypothetical protein